MQNIFKKCSLILTTTLIITLLTAMERPKLESKHDLVELIKLDPSFVLDIRYATDNNFTKRVIYEQARAFLNRTTAQKLVDAHKELKEKYGYSIKIFDAYRPQSVQENLWHRVPNEKYVANPRKGSVHTRGAAVDITLVDAQGKELEMPTPFDDFTEKAHANYDGSDLSITAKKNRTLLQDVMLRHGFKIYEFEWWHFNDADAKDLPLLAADFSDLK